MLAMLLLAAGCATHRVNPASLSPDALFARADTLYQAKEYGKAIPLLEAFVQQHVTDPRAPQAEFMLGTSYMARKEYLTAATNFQRLVEDFPGSPHDLDARFAICQAYVHLSPKPALDQEYTRAALTHCQSIADNFGGTTQATQAKKYVDQLQDKLAEKLFDTGRFYAKRKAYDSAVVYFRMVVSQYPQTSSAPAALQELAECYKIMGYVEDAEQARQQLLKDYPQSSQAQALRAPAS
jgi:outer membrane protein assembly factor BamD